MMKPLANEAGRTGAMRAAPHTNQDGAGRANLVVLVVGAVFQLGRGRQSQIGPSQTIDAYRDCPGRCGAKGAVYCFGAVSIGSFEVSRWRLRWARGSSYGISMDGRWLVREQAGRSGTIAPAAE
jgi:hypothetical protein